MFSRNETIKKNQNKQHIGEIIKIVQIGKMFWTLIKLFSKVFNKIASFSRISRLEIPPLHLL